MWENGETKEKRKASDWKGRKKKIHKPTKLMRKLKGKI